MTPSAANDREPCAECGRPPSCLEDWAATVEVAYHWASYWEDDPIVHLDMAVVGQLARAFLYAMAYFQVIEKPSAVSDA